MASTNSNAYKQREADHGHEDTMQQATTASISDMATAAETPKQERGQQKLKRAAGECSDPLIAPYTTSSLNGGIIQPTTAVVRQLHPESRSRRDGGSELVTGVTIKLTLQASTASRRLQFMQETNPLSSGVMVCGCFEVEVHRIW